MNNSVLADKSRTMATSVGLALAGLTLFAACVGDKVVEPRNGPELALVSRWRAPNGDLVGLTRLGMQRPSMDSVNLCHTAVYFGKRGATDPYRYDTKVLPSASHDQSENGSAQTTEVTRMVRFRFNVKLRRVTRMADCVIQNTPQMVATVKSLFTRRNASVASSVTSDEGVVVVAEEEEFEGSVESLSPSGLSEGEAAADARETFDDVVRDAVPSFMGSAIPTAAIARAENSPLFAPAEPPRGLSWWDCNWLTSAAMDCDSPNGHTQCYWIPGGGSSEAYACNNGCYVILGNSGSGMWCPDGGPGDPGEGCEWGQVEVDSECVCATGDNNLAPNNRPQIGGRSGEGAGEGEPEAGPGPFEPESPRDATLLDVAYLPVEHATIIRTSTPLGNQMPDCLGEDEDYEEIPPVQPPQIDVTCTPNTGLRGFEVVCTASSQQGTPQLQQWLFDADEAGFDNNLTTGTIPLTWAGRMIASGTVSATGKVNNVDATPGSTHVEVESRGWISGQPTHYVVEIVSDLPANPHVMTELGLTSFHVGLPIESWDLIEGGPNHNMSYMLTMYAETAHIRVNRQAFNTNPLHPFPGAHTVGGNQYCPRFQILGLEATIATHEGLGAPPSAGSHVKLFQDYLFGSNLGSLVEKIRDPTGEMTPTTVETAIASLRTAATTDSKRADASPLIPTLPCNIQWNY